MKKRLLFLFVLTILFAAKGNSQKIITISTFKEDVKNHFDDNTPITEDDLNTGFKLIIKNTSTIKKAQIKSQANPNFNDAAIGNQTTEADSFSYSITNPERSNNKLEIQLIDNNNKGKITTLIIRDQRKRVSVSTFNDQIVNTFEDKSDITLDDIKNGIFVQIDDAAKISSLSLDDEPLSPESDPSFTAAGASTYLILNPVIDKNEIYLKLSDAKNVYKILRIKIKSTPEDDKLCVPKHPSGYYCNETKNAESDFGENSNNYDENSILYVYDFNPKVRTFYKLIKKKSSGFDKTIANFNNETLTRRKNIKFKIVNINQFMYDVAIASSLVEFDSEPSALFNRMFLGDDNLLGNLMTNYASKSINAQSFKTPTKTQEPLQKKVSCFVQKYNWLQNEMLKAYDPCAKFSCCYSIDYLDIANELTDIRTEALSIQSNLEQKQKVIKENQDKIAECKTNEQNLKDNTDAITQLNKEIAKKPAADELKKLNTNLKKLQDQALKLQEAKKVCDTENKTYQENIDTEKKLVDELTGINDFIKGLPSDADLKAIIVFLRNMVESNNEISLDYIPLNGNILDLKINIASKDAVFKRFSLPDKYAYKDKPIDIQIPIVSHPFISFSSGSFIAIKRNLINKQYEVQEATAGSSTYKIVESGYTSLPMGFAALGNFERKFSRNFGIGPSIGVGLTIEDKPRLAYLAGASLFLGQWRQLTVTAGLAAMQVDKLNRNFQTAVENQTTYTTKPVLGFYKELKTGFFFSLTYTPFKSKPVN